MDAVAPQQAFQYPCALLPRERQLLSVQTAAAIPAGWFWESLQLTLQPVSNESLVCLAGAAGALCTCIVLLPHGSAERLADNLPSEI